MAATAANAVLDILADEDLTRNGVEVGAYFREKIAALALQFPDVIGDLRGMGLMLGINLLKPVGKAFVSAALSEGLIINATGETTIRLVPPLILTKADVDQAIVLMAKAIQSVEATGKEE